MNITSLPPSLPEVAPATLPATASTPAQAVSAPSQPDLSLEIVNDKAAGEMVYKTVNRATGEVVNQYPNEQLVRLREASTYEPGGLVRQSA